MPSGGILFVKTVYC